MYNYTVVVLLLVDLIHFPIALKFVPFETRYPPGIQIYVFVVIYLLFPYECASAHYVYVFVMFWYAEWIHDPSGPNPKMEVQYIPYSSTWRAMEALQRAGLTRFIGVSNINVQHLAEIWSYAEIKPVCNQVECHPYLVQSQLLEFCQSLGVKITAFSPLGSSSYVELGAVIPPGDSVLEQPLIAQIAKAHKKSPAQIILRWGVQRGCAVIAKSNKLERIAENKDIFNFELTADEVS